jgi:hypothetical protein
MDTPSWKTKGAVLVACNCDYGCPCNFNALPTKGKCEGQWTWHVEEGTYGDVSLDDLNFTIAVDWPGPIHEGNGKALILVDERADEAQRQAIEMLVAGEVGGPWGVLAWTWPTMDGPHPVPYELSLDGVSWRVRAAGYLEIESEPIRNPVTGAEVHPGAVLPEGIVFKQGEFGSSKTFRISNGIELEHPGKYTAIAPFEYAGP